MYFVGTFKRDYFELSGNDNPMSLVGFVETITRDHLNRAAADDDYQVINIATREYFDPKQNRWIKINNF